MQATHVKLFAIQKPYKVVTLWPFDRDSMHVCCKDDPDNVTMHQSTALARVSSAEGARQELRPRDLRAACVRWIL